MNMLLSLAVLAGVSLGFISGQPHPEECCTPMQYEGYTDGLTGTMNKGEVPSIVWAQQRFHVDHTYKRIARFFELFEEKEQQWRHIQIVQNYDTKKQYVVENGACHITDMDTMMLPACVHVDSEHRHTFHIGGANGLEVDSWRIPSNDPATSREIRTIRGPPEHCHPYQYIAMHPSTTATSWSDFVSYNRITEGIADTTVFEVPRECQHVRHLDLPDVVNALLEAFP